MAQVSVEQAEQIVAVLLERGAVQPPLGDDLRPPLGSVEAVPDEHVDRLTGDEHQREVGRGGGGPEHGDARSEPPDHRAEPPGGGQPPPPGECESAHVPVRTS
ncbi:hypothetical protein [Streptosporangium vulgare]|uniref:hypothetical protein n=1 Tax=Streptosporangium vulgare TaxID=46190 RepID=UPI0031D9B5F2